ncbi:hypothetical protein ACIA8O_06350 [Kitasatospora sp. NPDC051853]|uniref:hypothetical protein n=1 Tax=Kitasatospora sp. NPDC051853 TaxID=3364058 RepID=UPI00379287CD
MATDGLATLATPSTEAVSPAVAHVPAPPAHPIPVVPLWHAAPDRLPRESGLPRDPA